MARASIRVAASTSPLEPPPNPPASESRNSLRPSTSPVLAHCWYARRNGFLNYSESTRSLILSSRLSSGSGRGCFR